MDERYTVIDGTGHPQGARFTASVECPSGTLALGGGYTTGASEDVSIMQNRPTGTDGRSWVVYGSNHGAQPTITAYAICAKVG